MAGILIITLINVGALLEQRKWIYYLEIVRLFFFQYYSVITSKIGQSSLLFFGLLLMCVNKIIKMVF